MIPASSIPTSFLPGLGAAGGAAGGAALGGGGLGQLLYPLDLPRRALWAPIHQAATGRGSLLSALPAIGGVMGGVMAGAVPGPWQPFAPQIGVGTSALLQGVMEHLDPQTYHSPSAPEVANLLGMDGDNMLAAMAAGMLDPMIVAGGLSGGRLGGHVAGQIDDLAARTATSTARAGAEQAVAQESALLNELLGVRAMQPRIDLGRQMAGEVQRDLGNAASAYYRPDLVGAMPDLANMSPGMAGKVYKQVQPTLLEDMTGLGWGTPQGKGMQLVGQEIPDFAKSSGGWLQPALEEQKYLGTLGSQHPLKAIHYGGPTNIPPNMADPAWMVNPADDLARMRQGAGLGGGNGWTPPAQPLTAGQIMGPERTEQLLNQLGQDAIVPLPSGQRGYFTGMPADLAPGFAHDRLRLAEEALANLPTQNSPLSPTQILLRKLGIS